MEMGLNWCQLKHIMGRLSCSSSNYFKRFVDVISSWQTEECKYRVWIVKSNKAFLLSPQRLALAVASDYCITDFIISWMGFTQSYITHTETQ